MKRDADYVKMLITQLTRLDVFRVNTALREEDGDMDSISGDIPLVTLASKDSAPTDVVNDLLRDIPLVSLASKDSAPTDVVNDLLRDIPLVSLASKDSAPTDVVSDLLRDIPLVSLASKDSAPTDVVNDLLRDIPLVSWASKDSAPTDVVSDLLRAEERGKLHVITNVKQRLIEKTVGFHDVLKKHRSKTVATLYKATVSTKHNGQKTVKADRKLIQRLLNAVTGVEQLKWGVS